MSYRRVLFAEIKHLLPADAWAAWRNAEQAGEFEQESVLVFEESASVEELNLGAPFAESEHVFFILLKGNLTVEKHIFNEDTDGATGLIVLGDLRAGNMLVGGQEIYVTGNLMVKEVFWGDYNHGDLHVLGDITAFIFAETDQYSVTVGGQLNVDIHLIPYGPDGRWTGLNEGLVREHLIDDFVLVDEDGEVSLVRDPSIAERLKAGLSLLKPART